MKWEELPLADRALLMAAAVKNGYTDIRSIKAAYANFQNQRQQTGNMYDKGGAIDNDDVEVVNVLDEHPVWKALGNIDYETVADPEFTREKTGAGSIEYFSAEEPEGITYNNGYHRDHPMPGKDVILYNPDENDELDIRLDALHIMPKDPTYDTLNSLYREAARDSDVAWAAEQRYKEDVAKYGKEALDKAGMTPLTYFNNEADGFLRNMFIEGTPEYIESRRYYPNKQQLAEWNSHLMPYVNNIQQYLETGQRPDWLLPELTVTNQNAYGGNLFLTGGNKGKKKGITQQELQRRKNYYRQQLIIRGLRGALLEAVLANMEVESTFDPGAHNDASGARGLMQWLGSRKPKSWSEKDQLDYIAATYNKFGGNEWLDKNAWKRFNETTDPAEAARLLRRYWERPERSNWNATDKLFKNSKGSYLSQDVNDLVTQVSNLQYDEPKAPVFTEEDQRLLDTPALAFYNPEYEDAQASDYKPSALQESIKLDESLWRDPANNWTLYNQLANMQQGSSLDDPLSWMTMMASLSPNTTQLQKESASTMYQLFAPQGGDYSYHGLNFAAYGGKVNRFDGGGRTITIGELPEEYVRTHGNMTVVTPAGNRTTLSDTYKNYNQTPVNTNDVPGLTDYLITQDQPDIATAREVANTQSDRTVNNMWSIIPPGYPDRTTRRFWDVVMRNTGGGADPTGSLFPDGIYDIITHPRKTYRTLNYILGGNGPEEANLPSFGTEHAYNGFWTSNNKGFANSEPVSNSNDIISAYLGNGDIRSDLATKYSGIMKDSLISNNTPFEDYISQTYPNKDIQLYEFKLHPSYFTVPTDSIEFVEWQPWEAATEDEDIQIANGWIPDWAGHYIRRGLLPGHQTTVLQQADIWKFNPEEYDKKYNLDPISKWGIWQVDNIGNPVVTYTPPYYLK